MQFVAQSRHYTENYPDAEFQVIELDGQRIGRLYTQRRENEIRIMDIALLPEVRGRGIGTGLLNEILDEARAGNLPVTIHVERMNPALHLYERLGFRFLEERGIYFLMEWRAVIMEVEKYAG
jgi:ribosomal protein S18 acetylase RimI-like enzyme